MCSALLDTTRSVKIQIEYCNEKKVLVETTVRNNFEKSDKFGKSESHLKTLVNSEFSDKIG